MQFLCPLDRLLVCLLVVSPDEFLVSLLEGPSFFNLLDGIVGTNVRAGAVVVILEIR